MTYTVALVGNPNCGKTTLFNVLTGSRASVGNWPGVTVERKEGNYKNDELEIKIIDLPGIYSLSPYSEEEVVSRKFLLNNKPDLIINIVDATNIERNFYLTTQLVETNIPVIVALNMMDEVKSNGDKINIEKMQDMLGLEVVPISASKIQGINKLMDKAILQLKNNNNKKETLLTNTNIYPYVINIKNILTKNDLNDTFFTAVKLLESDDGIIDNIEKSNVLAYNQIKSVIDKCQNDFEGQDMDILIADTRYKFITSITDSTIVRNKKYGTQTISDKIDSVITNKYLAIPFFIFIMSIVFRLTFGGITSFIMDWFDNFLNITLSNFVGEFLINVGASNWAISLITEGIIPGVGMVLVVLPQIVVLFLFLSILEDSGYMARAAFIMDRLLRKFGLSGRSFVPMLMGFGCSVPAIMAARTLENEKDRRMTIILTPFFSCGAKLPVYSVFAAALFSSNKGTVILSLYLLGILVAIISGILLKSTVLKGEASTFIMELPPYRFPSLKNLFIHVWEKIKDFVQKASTILLASSIVIWFLQKFDFSLQMVSDNANSIFGQIGTFIAPIFTPLGFGGWRESVALLTGFVAKEAVVSTLGILYKVGDVTGTNDLSTIISNSFTPLKAYSYMTFILLYMPCVVAFATIKREMNSWKWTLFTVLYQTGVAYLVAFIVYQGGSLLL